MTTISTLNSNKMALLFRGLSTCPICSNVIMDNDKAMLFPPFIPNVKDALTLFHDAVFHQTCVLGHSLGQLVIELTDRFIFKTRRENRFCDIGGNIITVREDYIFISLLTSDVREPLYKFNFMNIDRNNIKYWKQKDEFIEMTKLFLNDGKWETPRESYLPDLIKLLCE